MHARKTTLITTIATLFIAAACLAGDTVPGQPAVDTASKEPTAAAPATTTPATEAEAEAAAKKKEQALRDLADDLIYSVNRTPERPFDTPRAVNVITREDIERRAGLNLSDILMEEAGYIHNNRMTSGSEPLIRGLSGRQVLIMLDGVKINNAMWRQSANNKEQLNLIDPSQIERIEIVRGVVSVLGTEALGGVINIITRKPSGTGFGGVVRARYASAGNAFGFPMEIWGGLGDRFRFTAGVTYAQTGDVRGGEGVGKQSQTSFDERGGHLNAQYTLTPAKTLSLGLQSFETRGAVRRTGTFDELTPNRLQLATLTYEDFTMRAWADSLNVTASSNRQDDGSEGLNTVNPQPNQLEYRHNTDKMYGLNVGLSKFLGSHQVLYGVDYSEEVGQTSRRLHDFPTGTDTFGIGRTLDGTGYDTLGVYVNDRFTIAKRLTVSAGVRYGIFSIEAGGEVPFVGRLQYKSTKRDTTGSLNLIYHVTPSLNLIASGMRGFRAPSIEDAARYNISATRVLLPQAGVEAEHVNSYETGVKYANRWLSGSAFYYHNDFSNLIRDNGEVILNGKNYLDYNGNNKKDSNEQLLQGAYNIGEATVSGYELDAHVTPRSWLDVFGNYAKTEGVNKTAGGSLALIQPKFGNVGVRVTSASRRWLPWGELVMRYGSSAEPQPNGTFLSAGYHVWTIRGGARITDRMRATVALENILDETYQTIGAASMSRPGRQVVLGFDRTF